MSTEKEKQFFPENLRTRFEKSGDLTFEDGEKVTAKEIWRFFKEDAPKRFPYTFDQTAKNQFGSRLSKDHEWFVGIKHSYILLSLRQRIIERRNKGTPVVLLQPFQTSEPYHAAGVIPLRTGTALYLAQNRHEGLNIQQFKSERKKFLESGRSKISVDVCSPQLSSYAVLQDSAIPVDFVSPTMCTRCSDIFFSAELYRSSKVKYPSFIIDYPVNDQARKPWAARHMAETLKRATKEFAKLSKKTVTEEDLWHEIKLENEARRWLQKYMELWWSAKVPPTNSIDHGGMPQLANTSLPDTTIGIQLLKEAYATIKERIKDEVQGVGLADEPVRIFGLSGGLNAAVVDEAGGVVVGTDDQWGMGTTLVKETGDPYENLAKAYLSYPTEQPLEERAHWVAQQVKKSRADGAIFRYQWGCNGQSAVARIICDIVKEDTGLPTLVVEQSENDTTESSEQLTTRAEAFIEMLRK